MRDSCPLTPRQREVLRALGGGETRKQIARRLGISPSTVREHTYQAYRRLGASNGLHAVAIMLCEGWLAQDDLLSYDRSASRAKPREHRKGWQPSPAQRSYLDAFDRLLTERSDEAARRLDRCFTAMCDEQGTHGRRSRRAITGRAAGACVDAMLLRVGRALIAEGR